MDNNQRIVFFGVLAGITLWIGVMLMNLTLAKLDFLFSDYTFDVYDGLVLLFSLVLLYIVLLLFNTREEARNYLSNGLVGATAMLVYHIVNVGVKLVTGFNVGVITQMALMAGLGFGAGTALFVVYSKTKNGGGSHEEG